MPKCYVTLISILFLLVSCMENPTPEDMGINFIVKTDSVTYHKGDAVTISFTNMSDAEVRVVEVLVKEEKTISFENSLLFFLEIQQSDGTWIKDLPYESNYSSEFPYHMRSGETKRWTSKKISEKFCGKKLRVGINYKDEANRYAFTGYSEIFEILN